MELPIIPLEVRRGDSYSFFWKIRKQNGNFFVPSENDEVLVGIKRNSATSTYLLKKIYTLEDFSDEGFYFTLSSNETANFMPANYEYDIGVKIYIEPDSYSFYHVVGVSPFIVKGSVTLP